MGILKGRNTSGGWSNASVVYAWNASGIKTYAKALFMRKSDGTWERGWTDCRQHDAAGGRDWNPPTSSSVTVSCGSCDDCGTNTKVVTTYTYTKDGCPSYTRTSETSCTGCTGSWSADTTSEVNYSGQLLAYTGTPGYYATQIGYSCRSCPTGCAGFGEYYVTICSVTGARRFTELSCGPCLNVFGTPC